MKAYDITEYRLDILFIESIWHVTDIVQFIDKTFHVQPKSIEL